MQVILKDDVSNIEDSYRAITVTSLDSLDVAVCRNEFSDLTDSERACSI